VAEEKSVQLPSDLEKIVNEDQEMLDSQLNTFKLKQMLKNVQEKQRKISPMIFSKQIK
jgi:hypothetical protein